MEFPEIETSIFNKERKIIWKVVWFGIMGIVFLMMYFSYHFFILKHSQREFVQKKENIRDIAFAEQVVLSFNNIDYKNLSNQDLELASLLSPKLYHAYEKYFLNQSFVSLINTYKIFITFQKIGHAKIFKRNKTEVAIQMRGLDVFYSNQKHSQIEIPFRFLVQISKNRQGKLIATKIEEL
jgi:hypothetical protein